MVCPDVSAPSRKGNMGTRGEQSGEAHRGRQLALTPLLLTTQGNRPGLKNPKSSTFIWGSIGRAPSFIPLGHHQLHDGRTWAS